MSRRTGLGLFMGAVLLLGLPSSEAAAQWGGWGGGFGSGLPYNWAITERPPYFALHPPVYYGRPVAHDYGYSPWARPGYLWSNVDRPQTVVVYNRYAASGERMAAEPAVKPLTYMNPFVTDAKK